MILLQLVILFSDSGYNRIANYRNKTNAGEVGKWICLSIHWDVHGGQGESSVWCNNQKLTTFTSRTSPCPSHMMFDDLNSNGVAPSKRNQ